MDKEIIEDYFISNGDLLKSREISGITIAEPSIYEVIRVIEGIPLFLEDHLSRLELSATYLKSSVEAILPNIAFDINKLIVENNYPEKNIKLLVFNLDKEVPDYILCFIKSSYPSKEQYEKGINTILAHAERSNPNAKVINSQLKEMITKRLSESKAYEALLVNNNGEITEGSRSNLFFTEQGKIYTAPAQDVLIGITRKYIIEACSNLGLEVIEQPIPYSMIDYAEGAFITGTSPKLLPIAYIEDRHLDSANNEIVISILKEYGKILERYIEAHK